MDQAAFLAHPKVQEARRLLIEAHRELRIKAQKEVADQVCECGCKRKFHTESHSINYTGGVCTRCDHCLHFLMR